MRRGNRSEYARITLATETFGARAGFSPREFQRKTAIFPS